MQTIGDRLEEARKHKGVSLREAAEATKIRGEYLSAFESNSFDINLPEIYVRGFLRNYANFLKLDAAQILTDYDSLAEGEISYAPASKREGRSESYGRMDLGETSGAGGAAADQARAAPQDEESATERRRESTFAAYQGLDKALYLKVGGIVAGGLVVVFLLVSGVFWVIGSDTAEPANSAAEETGAQEFFLVAREDISNVRVVEVDTGLDLYQGALDAGARERLLRNGPVDIFFSNGEHLRIEQDGSRFRVGGSGEGRARFDL